MSAKVRKVYFAVFVDAFTIIYANGIYISEIGQGETYYDKLCDRAESFLRLLTRDIVLRKSSRFHSRSSLPASL